ncbi:hypothetical protein, partial [Thiolapillus sp.]|uniref:hypothetical protein n=1 Tax=Thiolapillus sp. TaxID=2017437 RepID=UPI003AF40F2E
FSTRERSFSSRIRRRSAGGSDAGAEGFGEMSGAVFMEQIIGSSTFHMDFSMEPAGLAIM